MKIAHTWEDPEPDAAERGVGGPGRARREGDGIREGIAAGASFHSWEDPETDADFLSLCDSDSMLDADSDFDGDEMDEEDAFIAYTTDLLIAKKIMAQQD